MHRQIAKVRTREHILADLSVNHVERFVLRCGHTAQLMIADYGYDLIVQTFDDTGAVEPGYVLVQLKASDKTVWSASVAYLSVVIERAHIEAWLRETSPMYLIHYDAPSDRAYWFHVNSESNRVLLAGRKTNTISVRIPAVNLLDEAAIQRVREEKRHRNRTSQQRKNS